MNFTVINANIVNVKADAIVLPANEKLKEGAGASRAIFEAAGRKQLKEACDKIAHCDIGSAVPTSAFALDATYIIHAVVPAWIDGNHDEYALLSSAYLTSLELADIMGCETIAFPLLASGNNGFNKELAFRIAEESIRCFEGKHLKNVILIAYGESTADMVKSFGYDVITISEKRKAKKSVISDDAKKKVADGLKVAADWLKNPEHQQMVLKVGLGIVGVVFPKSGKAISNLKKIMK